MLQNALTFVDRVIGTSKPNLKRPTCLNFTTKENLKRHEVIELLKEIILSLKINRCGRNEKQKYRYCLHNTTRHFVYNIRHYEFDTINFLLGLVPISLSNEKIKRTVKEIFG